MADAEDRVAGDGGAPDAPRPPDGVEIALATPDDVPRVSALIAGLAHHVADAATPGAAQAFGRAVEPARIAEIVASPRFVVHVARAPGALAGVVAVMDRTHVYHFFVAEAFQRRGLGRRLWAHARAAAAAAGAPGRFTLNSSPFAVPVYRAFGFVETGPREVRNGVGFVPMVLEAPLA